MTGGSQSEGSRGNPTWLSGGERSSNFMAPFLPRGWLGEVCDIAPALVYFASDDSDFVIGRIFFMDGGYSVP